MTLEPRDKTPDPLSEPRVPVQANEPGAPPVAAGPVPVPARRAWDPGLHARIRPQLPGETGTGAAANRPAGRTRRAGSRRAATPRKKPRNPAVALPAVILFGLLAAFFAWQAAEPLWLALGHGVAGTATVARCHPTDPPVVAATGDRPSGPTYRCVTFAPADRAFHAVDVTLLGTGGVAGRAEGSTVPAQMVGPDHGRAYATGPTGLHLRWSIGLALVLACGAGIAWAAGATRLEQPRSRRRALLLSFAGPLLLAAGFLIAAL